MNGHAVAIAAALLFAACRSNTGSEMPPPPPTAVCQYPTGANGVDEGKIVPGELAWQGFAPGVDQPSTVEVANLFDCDGSRGIDALLFDSSSVDCDEGCPPAAMALDPAVASWKSAGLRITPVVLLITGHASGAPTIEQLRAWQAKYGLHAAYFVTDPTDSMIPSGALGLPVLTVVDPRTMKVARVQEGYGGAFPPELEQIAKRNRGN